MSNNVCYSSTVPSSSIRADTPAGNQMQEKLRTWLSPPDSSINHNHACKTQHDGTATWFIHGTKFREWKNNGSLLWINGNCTLIPPALCDCTLIPSPIPQPALAKAYYGTRYHQLISVIRNSCCWSVPPLSKTSRT